MIYQPAEDSWLLANQIPRFVKGKKVLDMCSGSGIQAEKALEAHASSVTCAEIDEESLKHLKKKKLNSIQSDLFSNIKEKFDVIICNPPYLPKDAREDHESARITSGGKKGDEFIIRFLLQAVNHLNKNGTILLVLSSLTPSTRIKKIVKESKFKMKIEAKENVFMEKLYVVSLRKIK